MNHNDIQKWRKGYELLCQVSGQPYGTDPVKCAALIGNATNSLAIALVRSLTYLKLLTRFGFGERETDLTDSDVDVRNGFALDIGTLNAAPTVRDAADFLKLPTFVDPVKGEEKKVVVPERPKLVVVRAES